MSLQVITKAKAQQNLELSDAKARAGVAPDNAKTDADAKTTPDPYRERLLKLIPAEVVSVYLAVSVLLPGVSSTNPVDTHGGLRIAIFIVLLVVNVFYKRSAGVTDLKQLAITSLAFIIWVLSLGGPVVFKVLGEDSTLIGAVLTPLVTLIAPLIYK
jgi:hypothetical protein